MKNTSLFILSVLTSLTIGCGEVPPDDVPPAVNSRPPASCAAGTCDGCCDLQNRCQASSARTCGVKGASCQDCGVAGACGSDGGSCVPPPTPGCLKATECPAYDCACADGTTWSSQRCENGACSERASTCENACVNHGGAPVLAASQFGCRLSAFMSSTAQTVTYFGTGATTASATTAALEQCRRADLAEWFCASAQAVCGSEVLLPQGCTFSKFYSATATTINYSADGVSVTAAKKAMVDVCLTTGVWQNWFCGSGTLTCQAH